MHYWISLVLSCQVMNSPTQFPTITHRAQCQNYAWHDLKKNWCEFLHDKIHIFADLTQFETLVSALSSQCYFCTQCQLIISYWKIVKSVFVLSNVTFQHNALKVCKQSTDSHQTMFCTLITSRYFASSDMSYFLKAKM